MAENPIIGNGIIGSAGGAPATSFMYFDGQPLGVVVGATLLNSQVMWNGPNGTFTGKNPPDANFATPGVYTLTVTNWSKVSNVTSNNNDVALTFSSDSLPTFHGALNLVFFSGLDFSGVPGTTTLNLQQTQLTSLDLTGMIHVAAMDISNSSIMAIDFTKLPALTSFVAMTTPLTGLLDVSSCPALATLIVNTSSLTALNIAGLANLFNTSFSDNLIDTVTMGGNTSLVSLNLMNNALPESVVDNILATIVADGPTDGNLDLSGTGNSPPSAAGLVNAGILTTRRWSVVTN
jgi:hypothetical protein